MIDFQEDPSHAIDFQLDFQPVQESPASNTLPGVLNNLKGAGVGIMDAVGGIPGFGAGTLAGLGTAIRHGDPTGGLDLAKEVMEKSTPSAALGMDMSNNAGYNTIMKPFEWINTGIEKAGQGIGNISKALGVSEDTAKSIDSATQLALLGGMALGGLKGKAKGNVDVPKQSETLNKVYEAQSKIDAEKKLADTGSVIDFKPNPDDPFSQMKQQLDVPQELPNQPHPVIEDMVSKLQEEPTSAEQMNKGEVVDKQIADRQAQMEFEVKKQAGLDYNAAERARQESAPVKLDDAESNVSHELLKAELPRETSSENNYVPKSQAGRINPEVFKEGFEKIKQLANGISLRAFSHGDSLTIQAMRGNEKVGGAIYEKSDKYMQPTQTDLAATMVGSKQKGMATELYKFASELGNDIVPSKVRTKDGSAMWNSFERRGISQGGRILSPGSKQMGALRIGEKKQKAIDKLVGRDNNMIPRNPDPAQAVQEALQEGKDSKQWTYTESGSTLAAMKRGSAAVLAASRTIQNAVKRADLEIRKNVLPTEDAFRKLDRGELTELAELMKQEMTSGKKFDTAALENLSVKQQEAYAHMRAMFDDTLKIQNEARAAKGQEPITGMEAYMSSRWNGDFRRPVFQAVLDSKGNPKTNADGSLQKRLVWYLASNTKLGLEMQTKALRKEHPDYSFDPKDDHVVRYYKRQTDLQSTYTTLLDILGRDDPAVQKIKEAVEVQSTNEAATFLGQEKHFEKKMGVRGFVGDRPGHSGAKEALAMFQQQIQYAKNAYKWSELQKSSQDIKTIISDPHLNEQQPNNVKYIKEYFKNAVGFGEDKAMAHIEDSVRNLGVSPALLDKGIGGMKSFFILQKLGVSTGFAIANMVQIANVIPHLTDLYSKGHKGNPLTAMAVGLAGGIAMATGHYVNAMGKKSVSMFDHPEGKFLDRAFKYAEDNGVTARSIYDESPIESSFTATGRVSNAIGTTLSTPETFVRSISYMTYVKMLKDGSKFKDETSLFQKAEELVNASMVDYRAQERPLAFSKLGIAGNALNTLQTFPMNWYNQWNYFGREAMKGNVAPFIAAFALQYAVAGAMGVPGFNDMIKLYDIIKDNVLSNTQYAKLRSSPFLSDPKMWMVENFGQSSVYGVLSDKTGVGLTSRVNAPGFSEMIQAPGGPLLDIAKQVGNVASAAVDPTNSSKWAQAGMASAPPGLQGNLETAPFMEGKTFEKRNVNGQEQRVYQRPGDIADHKGVYARTPQEDTLRKFGLRSQQETISREMGYRTDKANQVATQRSRTIPDAFYDALKRGDKDRASELFQVYTKLTGTGISGDQLETQIKENYMSSIERSSSAAKTVMAMQGVARMRALMTQIQKENSK